jgi:hypothetical protein
MAKPNDGKLNQLERDLPEGLLVDAAWLRKRGYSTSLRSQYVTSGRLEQPAHRVYRKPRGALSWQQVVVSLQTLLEYPLVVGGRSALELQGFAHYLPRDTREVHLYGPKPPPTWLRTLPLGARFVYHNDHRIFHREIVPEHLVSLTDKNPTALSNRNFTVQSWGQWDWPLVLSSPERAILELLDEVPKNESFEQADKFMHGLPNLSPTRLQKLLADCHNVKVKRLFFFFADRSHHAWLKHLSKNSVDLGAGKRMLVKGGKLDPFYKITVPEDMNALS